MMRNQFIDTNYLIEKKTNWLVDLRDIIIFNEISFLSLPEDGGGGGGGGGGTMTPESISKQQVNHNKRDGQSKFIKL